MEMAALNLRLHTLRRFGIMDFEVHCKSPPFIVAFSTAQITVFDYPRLKDYIAHLFDGPVDVVNRDGMKPYLKPAAAVHAIDAF